MSVKRTFYDVEQTRLKEEWFEIDGKKNGPYKGYWDNGQLYEEVNYINGEGNGIYKLYWKNIEDGNYIYNVQLDDGFYTTDKLLNMLTSKLNSVPRINNTLFNKKFLLDRIKLAKKQDQPEPEPVVEPPIEQKKPWWKMW